MRQENAIREGAGQEMPGGDVLAHQLAGLDLYVSETRVPPPTGAAGWIALFPTLRENFELILIDSPPLERSQDGILLSLDVDTNLLVVRAERTQARVARDLRDRILDMGGPISGVVLNQRREHIPAALRRYV
jgi:Mrp family chromosome partitioning ATPase